MDPVGASQLLPVIGALLDADNAARGAAEAAFAAAVEGEPDRLALALLTLCGEWVSGALQIDAAPAVRSLCGVLLRRHLCGTSDPLWPRLAATTQATVRAVLVRAMDVVPPPALAELGKRLGDVAAELFEECGDEWPELVPALLGAVEQRRNTVGACDALRAVARQQRGAPGGFWAAAAGVLRGCVERALQSSQRRDFARGGPDEASWIAAVGERRAAVRALGSLLSSSPNDVDAGAEDAAVQVFLQAGLFVAHQEVSEFLQNNETSAASREAEKALRDGLEALLEVSEEKAALLRSYVSVVAEKCLAVAVAAEDFPEAPRALALELCVSLAEASPSMMRKCRVASAAGEVQFAVAAVDAAFVLLSWPDDEELDEAAYARATVEDPELIENDDECPSGIDRRDMGAEALSRLGEALKPKYVLPRAFANCRVLLQQAAASTAQWRQGRAALQALTQLFENLEEHRDEPAPKGKKGVVAAPQDFIPLLVRDAKATTKLSAKKRRADALEAVLRFGTEYPVAATRRAALDAVAQLAVDAAPKLQQDAHATVIPALCAALDREKPDQGGAHRCRAAAARGLCHFLDHSTLDIVKPYLAQVAAALGDAISPTAPSFVREHAVAAVAALASAVESDADVCRTLYAMFAPSLRPLCCRVADGVETSGELRARALECLALLGSAAGREVFAQDAVELLRVVTADYFDEANKLNRRPEDEAERGGALRSVVRVAQCLGADFAPFLGAVLPPLISAATGEDIVVTSSGDNGDGSDDDDDFVVRTEALEEQASACQLVIVLAETMAEHFATHAESCVVALAPLASNALADDVRSLAMAALPELVKCVALRDAADLGDGSRTRAVATFCVGALLGVLDSEADMEPLITALQSTRQTIEDACRSHSKAIVPDVPGKKKPAQRARPETSVPLLLHSPSAAPRHVLEKLMKVLCESIQRRAVRKAQQTVDPDYQDEEGGEDRDEELQFNISECVGAVLRTHGVAAFESLEPVWVDRLAEMAHAHCLESDRKFAAFVIADVFEFALLRPLVPDDAAALIDRARGVVVSKLLPAVLAMAADAPAPDAAPRRQAATYALGVAAQFCGPHFHAHAPAVADVLCRTMAASRAAEAPVHVVEDVDDEEDDDDDYEDDDDDAQGSTDEFVSDNACAALHLLLSHQDSALRAASPQACDLAWAQWIRYLPLQADAEEADRCAHALCAALAAAPAFAAHHASDAFPALARMAQALQAGACDTTARRPPACPTSLARLDAARADRARRGIPSLAAHLARALQALNAAPDAQRLFALLPQDQQTLLRHSAQ
ncbi:armadillo-type protein [Pelagophyceae sp. CCMP2097]|nr:armadillo-type protein [Pelagophyceae sp. CCMP2097]